MKIRIISRTDVPSLAKINKCSMLQNVSEQYLEHFIFDGAYKTIYLVAEEKSGQIVGYIGICYLDGDDGADLCDIAVLPEYRGKGIASALMENGIHMCEKVNVKRIILEVRETNAAAIALYSKFGFEKKYKRENYYTAPIEDADVMEKIIVK